MNIDFLYVYANTVAAIARWPVVCGTDIDIQAITSAFTVPLLTTMRGGHDYYRRNADVEVHGRSRRSQPSQLRTSFFLNRWTLMRLQCIFSGLRLQHRVSSRRPSCNSM